MGAAARAGAFVWGATGATILAWVGNDLAGRWLAGPVLTVFVAPPPPGDREGMHERPHALARAGRELKPIFDSWRRVQRGLFELGARWA